MTPLFLFFAGVGLCFLRPPTRDRWRPVLCAGAVAVWLGVLLIEPRARTGMFVLITGGFLMSSLGIRSRVPKP